MSGLSASARETVERDTPTRLATAAILLFGARFLRFIRGLYRGQASAAAEKIKDSRLPSREYSRRYAHERKSTRSSAKSTPFCQRRSSASSGAGPMLNVPL